MERLLEMLAIVSHPLLGVAQTKTPPLSEGREEEDG
jgi:hypothetical protein